MRVFRSIQEIPYQENSCITIGTFDGIHLGHRKIIEELVWKAQQEKYRCVLVTFFPHPQTVIRNRKVPIELLTPLDEKLIILEEFGLDVVLVLPFTRDLSRTDPKTFVTDILVGGVGIRGFIIGYNHAFGRERMGSAELLKELGEQFGFSVDVVEPVEIDGKTVSSTRIRHHLKKGFIRQGNRLLGRNYSLEGIVKKGKNLGEKFGFPTANIDVNEKNKLIPGDGVYAVMVHVIGERLPGMANIGYNPTLEGTQREIEVHIHNFSGDIYDKKVKVEFIDRIRDERQFDSIENLVTQIELDRKVSIELLSKIYTMGDRNGINERKKIRNHSKIRHK